MKRKAYSIDTRGGRNPSLKLWIVEPCLVPADFWTNKSVQGSLFICFITWWLRDDNFSLSSDSARKTS